MKLERWAFFIVALSFCSMSASVLSSDDKPTQCSDSSRDCLLAVAQDYLRAMFTGNGSVARLSADVQRTVQGGGLVAGAEAIRESLDNEPEMRPRGEIRYFVDEAESTVVVFARVSVEPADAGPAIERQDAVGENPLVHIVQRMKVVNGLISEIEVIYFQAAG